MLIERLEAAFYRFKERRESEKHRFGHFNPTNLETVPEDLQTKDKELKSASIRSNQIKKDILKVKRMLDGAYDIGAITELENEIKNKEVVLARFED